MEDGTSREEKKRIYLASGHRAMTDLQDSKRRLFLGPFHRTQPPLEKPYPSLRARPLSSLAKCCKMTKLPPWATLYAQELTCQEEYPR